MEKKIGLWDLVFMNVSALFGIRWIAKATASSFGLGLGSIPTWIILATSLLPSVDAIYNVLVTMTALTALFPYVLLFASYIRLRKIRPNEIRPNEIRPYELSKNNSRAIAIATMVQVVVILGIVLSASPVMGTLKENIIYESEMIGGALVVILSGNIIWNRFVKRTNFKEVKKAS